MGTDDLFKKRREQRKKRGHEYRTPQANSFLIVTEGKRTEPYYFEGMKKLILDAVGGNIDVIEVPKIDICGEGCSTGRLLEATEQAIKNAKILYQNVWVVFDKDDFSDFDQAIKEGADKGYNIAWSNQCFEYWLYLHFEYSDSALHRDVWKEKLNQIFKSYNLGNGNYEKNLANIYDLVNTYDGVNTAIRNAKRRMSDYNKKIKPSTYDPGTTVHELVGELKQFLE